MTKTLKKSMETMAEVIDLLRHGAVVILPTASVYGLVTNGNYSESVDRIYELKGRDRLKPLSFYTCPEQAEKWGVLDERARGVIGLWPSAVSLIVPKTAAVQDYITSGMDSVLLTCLDSYVEELARRADFPVVATSANMSNEPAITDFNVARDQFEGKVDLILDGGTSREGLSSTIVNLSANPPFIQRQGPVSAETLLHLIPELFAN